MSESQTIEYNFLLNVDIAMSDVRKLEMALIRCLNIAQRFTGDENLKKGIATIQRSIMTLRSLQAAYHAVQIARMAAGDPLAWFSAGATVLSVGFTVTDFMMSV